MLITVFTPTYNRADKIHRVMNSLMTQTYKDFEWIIVDDGSTDNTKEVVDSFIQQNPFFQIRYFYQENKGKHNATNFAVKKAEGEFFVTVDSDDGCKPEALEVLVKCWNTIPEGEQKNYKSVTCRSCPLDRPDEIIGTNPTNCQEEWIDCSSHDLFFKYNVTGDLWGMERTAILKEIPFPAIDGLHYFPEGVYYGTIGFKYKLRFFNIPLLYLYPGGNDHISGTINYKEGIYSRIHAMNELLPRGYFKYKPVYFFKEAVGLIRDGLLNEKKLSEILKIPNNFSAGLLAVVSIPLGFYLYKKEKKRLSDRKA